MWAVPYMVDRTSVPQILLQAAAREGVVNLSMSPPCVNGSDVYFLEEGS